MAVIARTSVGGNAWRPKPACRPGEGGDDGGHNGGSIASSYSFLKRAINSAAGTIPSTLPMPWPEPQISFHAFGLARSPEASVPKLILVGSEVGSLSGSMPAATTDGFR